MTDAATEQPDAARSSNGGATSTLAEREAAALRELVELVQWRAAESGSIETTHAERTSAAQSEHEQATAAARATRNAADESLAREVESATSEIKARHASEAKEENKRYTLERGTAESKLDSRQKDIEAAITNAKWMADAVYDAGGKQPEQEVRRVRGEVKAELERLEMAEAVARKLAGPRVAMPETMPPPIEEAAPAPDDEQAVAPAESIESDTPPPVDRLVALREEVEQRVQKLGGVTLHAFFRLGGPILLMFIALVAGAFAPLVLQIEFAGLNIVARMVVGGLAAAIAVGALMLPLRVLAFMGTRKRLEPIAAKLIEGRTLAREAVAAATAYKQRVEAEIAERRKQEIEAGKARYMSKLERVKADRARDLADIDQRHASKVAEIDRRREQLSASMDRRRQERAGEIERTFAEATRSSDERLASEMQAAEAERDERAAALRARWLADARRLTGELTGIEQRISALCPDWADDDWAAWQPPPSAAESVGVGRFEVRMADLEGGVPEDAALLEGVPTELSPPAVLDFPGHAALLILADAGSRPIALATLQNTMMRLVTAIPPGKVRFTMIDPVGLGQSFAAFMRLADHDERLVSNRIWTEARHIEQRLMDLTEHMETVIQKYLRNEFASIEAYNREAGEIAEPYRFLVVADLPENFSEEAGRRLMSVIESGPKCGVYTLIHADAARKLPETIKLDVIEAASTVVRLAGGEFTWDEPVMRDLPVQLESPPDEQLTARLLDLIGERSLEVGRVEVPFGHLTPQSAEERWSADASSEIRVPLGRAGATKLQRMSLGRGTSQHVLIAGKTGSGKSTLLHVLITNMALWFSPREVEFYLVDFKKGVEFKAYAGGRLPHARAVAVESDREFGLSVLQKLDEELKRRGDLFRALGVQSLAAARQADPSAHLPRVMLIIDEFQEFFTEDDRIAQDASLLMDRLVRQGRAFGMHVLLGSQTLSGAYTLARSTVGQMAVRVALQCSETDSYLILSEDNNAARLLNRPGEAIYNDANGMVEGNNPFQIAWLADETRDEALDTVHELLDADGWTPPEPQIVFEGNIPADLDDNHLLRAHVANDPAQRAEPPKASLAWLGDPVAIKDPTAAVFRRQSGANLLIVGQQDETARAMMGAAVAGLLAQHALGPEGTRLYLLDATTPDDPHADYLRGIADTLGNAGGVAVRSGGPRDVAEIMAELDAERSRREAEGDDASPPWFLAIFGLQRMRALRKKEDDFSFSFSGGDDDDGDTGSGPDPASALADLLRDGPPLGMHSLVWVDTAANLSRAVDRQSVSEFEQRALLQMSATDSANLIDTPAAGKLGMNRGLLYIEELGTTEKFRPYSMTPRASIERLAEQITAAAQRA